MDKLIEKAGEVVLGLGFPGVVIIVLAWFIYKLLGEIKTLNKDRLEDTRLNVKAIEENSRVLTTLTDLVKETIRGRV